MSIAAKKAHEPQASGASPELGVVPATAPLAAATFTFPNRVLFNPGARKLLSAELARLGITRPLVVTDPGLVAIGLTAMVAGPLGKQAVVFSDVAANPTEDDVLSGSGCYRGEACDGLVAIGGGSPIDAAKAIRLLVTHLGRLADYDLTRGRPGQDHGRRFLRWWPCPRQRGRAARWAEAR